MPFRKIVAFFYLLAFLMGNAVALTDGPMMPEYASFQPVDVTDIVDLPTGDFTYNIPLLGVPSASGIEFPINIFYRAGIGVNDEASWTGLGWNINTGSIQRSVAGVPDDFEGRRVYKRSSVQKAYASSYGIGILGVQAGRSYSSTGGTGPLQLGFAMSVSPDPSTGKPKMNLGSKGNVFSLASQQSSWLGAKDSRSMSEKMGASSVRFASFGIDLSIRAYGYSLLNAHYNGIWLRFKQNFDVDYYGFLYTDESGLDDIFPWDLSGPGVKKIPEGGDILQGTKYYHGYRAVPYPMKDNYICMGQGLSGTFSPYKKGKLQLLVPELTNLYRDCIIGHVYSEDYVDNHKSSDPASSYLFRFHGDEGGFFQQDGYYDAGYDGPGNGFHGKRIVPIYDENAMSPTHRLLIGFRITKEDGVTYEYMKPVYEYSHYTETSNQATGTRQGHWNASGTHPGGNLDNTPDYAYCWLLTSIKGPDYLDETGDGLTADDQGYWVRFAYEQTTDNYDYRIPFEGKAVPPQYEVTTFDLKESPVRMNKMFNYGRKGLWYLRNVVTGTHVAVFNISSRLDAFECDAGSLVTGGVKGQDSYQKLDEILLFERDALPSDIDNDGILEAGEAVGSYTKRVLFNYDYSLCPGTPNSQAGGKLTLKAISIGGKGGVQLPPYRFAYIEEDGNDRFTYGTNKWDRWGYYKSDGLPEEHLAVNKNEVAAWSLKKISFPTGGALNIEYESDRYNYIYDRPVCGKMDEWYNPENHGPDELRGYRWLAYDDPPTFPGGPGIIEMRYNGDGVAQEIYPGDHTSLDGRLARIIPSKGKRNLRVSTIHKNELPEGYFVSRILAFAYVDKGNGVTTNPVAKIVVEGQKQNGDWVAISSNDYQQVGSPQWMSGATDPAMMTNEYIRYKVYVRGWNGNIIGDRELAQRDFRIFFFDQQNPKTNYSKYGGGLRTKRLTFTDGLGNSIGQEYYYDSNGDGTGQNTGVATKEPPIYADMDNNDRKLASDYLSMVYLPGAMVLYNKVTVQQTGAGKTEHKFVVPAVPEPFDSRNHSTVDIGLPIPEGMDAFNIEECRRWQFSDRSAIWGKPYSIKKLDQDGNPVATVEYNYEGPSVTNKNGIVSEEAVSLSMLERFGFTGHKVSTATNEVYPYTLTSIETTQDGVAQTENRSLRNLYNGLHSLTETTNGAIRKFIKKIWAFQKYDGMAETDPNSGSYSSSPNMLTQECAEIIYSENTNADHVVSAEHSTWTDQKSDFWLRDAQYAWRVDMGQDGLPEGTHPGFPYNTRPAFDNGVWKQLWRGLVFDRYGKPIYERDGANTPIVTTYGASRLYPYSFSRNAQYGEVIAESFEDFPIGRIADRVGGGETGTIVSVIDSDAHTGAKCLTISKGAAADQYWVSSNTPDNLELTTAGEKKILWEFWAKADAPTSSCTHLQPNQAGIYGYGEEYFSLTTDWKKYSFTATIPDGITPQYHIVLRPPRNPANGQYIAGPTVFIDGIRAYPEDALMQSFTYDDELGKMTSALDESNNANYFEYDGLGRLTKSKNSRGELLSEAEYHYGREGTRIYVDVDATGNNTGHSWENAYTDLRTAIGASKENDVFWIAEGVYYAGQDANASFVLKSGQTLLGGFAGNEDELSERVDTYGTNATYLDGNIGGAGEEDNTLIIVQGANSCELDNLLIRNGRKHAVALNAISGFRINACQFYNNKSKASTGFAGYGAAILIRDSRDIYITGTSTFSSCEADAAAGAIYANGATNLFLENAIFHSNKAGQFAGAVSLNNSSACSFVDCHFKEHKETPTCGVLDINESNVSISGGQFYNNEATGFFGAIWAHLSTVNISGVLIAYNDALAGDGGAIMNDAGTMLISDCEFKTNTASRNAGAVYSYEGRLRVAATTFSNNSAGSTGGAIACFSPDDGIVGYLNQYGNTFSGNSAPSNKDIYTRNTNIGPWEYLAAW